MKTLIFNYYQMIPGGIETGFAKLMSYAMAQGHRTIWITDEKHYKEASFRNVVEDERLEKVYVNAKQKLFGKLPSTLKFQNDEEIVMLTCQMDRFVLGERIRKNVKVNCFQHYLLVAHFTGKYDFPEQWFERGKIRKKAEKYLSGIAQKIVENDCIRAFSAKHLDAFEKAYNVVITEKESKLWRGIEPVPEFPLECVEKKASERKDKFNILTCARFEFPHKGYLVGLIEKYAQVKKMHPQVSLTIVGYGDGEKQLREAVDRLEPQAKKDIHFTGMLDSLQLEQQYTNAHLNIGVAGALVRGVKMGVPSLSCRHYSYTCETYGFWGNSYQEGLSSKEGEDIMPYINKCIDCSIQEYIQIIKKDFDLKRENDLKNYNPNYFFEQTGNNSAIITRKDFFKAVLLQIRICIKKFIRLTRRRIFERISK